MVELVFLGEVGVDLGDPGCSAAGSHRGQAVIGLRANNQINHRLSGDDLSPLGLGDKDIVFFIPDENERANAPLWTVRNSCVSVTWAGLSRLLSGPRLSS